MRYLLNCIECYPALSCNVSIINSPVSPEAAYYPVVFVQQDYLKPVGEVIIRQLYLPEVSRRVLIKRVSPEYVILLQLVCCQVKDRCFPWLKLASRTHLSSCEPLLDNLKSHCLQRSHYYISVSRIRGYCLCDLCIAVMRCLDSRRLAEAWKACGQPVCAVLESCLSKITCVDIHAVECYLNIRDVLKCLLVLCVDDCVMVIPVIAVRSAPSVRIVIGCYGEIAPVSLIVVYQNWRRIPECVSPAIERRIILYHNLNRIDHIICEMVRIDAEEAHVILRASLPPA